MTVHKFDLMLDDIEVENAEGTDTIAVEAAITAHVDVELSHGKVFADLMNVKVDWVLDDEISVDVVDREIRGSFALRDRIIDRCREQLFN